MKPWHDSNSSYLSMLQHIGNLFLPTFKFLATSEWESECDTWINIRGVLSEICTDMALVMSSKILKFCELCRFSVCSI